ncbi:hypothetical protein CH251_17125 [Rhodococcus sp. 06-462-5]|nr:hypothetical protein CH251_17125 [Rhodococcus sp. 06-462-5]OZE68765.1 hypothetical protein CH270_03025 [Rhodococcus sp. 02-925g]
METSTVTHMTVDSPYKSRSLALTEYPRMPSEQIHVRDPVSKSAVRQTFTTNRTMRSVTIGEMPYGIYLPLITI